MDSDSAYSSITIVGVGLIGGSLALALRRAGFRGRIRGVSRRETLKEAKRLGAIDEGFPYEELARAATSSELILLTSPISTILEHIDVLGQSGDELRPGSVISDVGSTKGEILERAEASLPSGVHFIGGHPLAGSEQRGLAAADALLFENTYYVLSPGGKVPDEAVARFGSFIASTGARVMVLDAYRHDKIAAAISHLPQLLAVQLVNFLELLGTDRERAARLAAGGFRDMTRIASSAFSVWKDIIATNRREILEVLEQFSSRLRQAAGNLDEEELAAAFEQAANLRAEIPRDTKGFLSRLWELLVVVEDRPGVIADVASRLAAASINIKDIEVLKVREGESGSLRLAFATHEVALQALEVLHDGGYPARLRE